MNELTTTNTKEIALSEDFMSEIEGAGILGYSEKASDSLIPIISILQDNSAEVKKKHGKYIVGAEPGMIIVRALQMVMPAELDVDALLFQPCGFDHNWVEWQGDPGEGAVVAQYNVDHRPDEAVLTVDPQNEERTFYKMPNGNRLVETRYHYGNLVTADKIIPAVIAMSGSNHSASKQWTTLMKQARLPGSGKKCPSFFRLYGITTKFTQRGEQSWFKYGVSDRGFIQDQTLLRAGLDLAKAVAEQKVTPLVDAEASVVSNDDDSPI